jgi:DNA-binding NarL/FixJ family response regulator
MTIATNMHDATVVILEELGWTCLIVDLLLPDGSGLDVLRRFRAAFPVAPALVLSGECEPTAVNAAYDLRAAYVVKPLDSTRIHNFLQATHWYADPFSPREREVVRLALLGREPKVIACELGLAASTVRVMLSRAMAKVGVRSHSELLAKAEGLGIMRCDVTT